MRLFSREKPKIKIQTTRQDGFSGWLKCTHCNELIHTNELEKNFNCCPKCDYHYRLPAEERILDLADEGTFQELFDGLKSTNALGFVDTDTYENRLSAAIEKSGDKDAIIVGKAEMSGLPIALAVMDFSFMGGSMGSVVGEKLTRLIEVALEERRPLVVISTSGGARMQESIFSLMQMAKTSSALAKLHQKKVPFISILTNPTSGGVTASFASLGDVIIAEPNALICFAGPRVVEQIIRQKLPPDAQKSEFLLKHGMIDCIVRRPLLKKKITSFLEFLTHNERSSLETR
ncbi:MAG: accD [Chlamydiales bacterium]|jgi:acetyl-CoA carboxylase carboxyl transferase subunit beta|nr:accD [Chlamydiales bacterium]